MKTILHELHMKHSIIGTLFLIPSLCIAAPEPHGFVNVADFVAADGKSDAADGIQKLIDANPNRTLWFADGIYLLSKPICTPATYRT